MTTKYQHRVTIAAPEQHIADANQIALVLGESAHDDRTFSHASYQDSLGNLYALASTVVKPIFAQMAGQPLQAPVYAPDADIISATRAQALLRVNDGPATPDVIAVILGDLLEYAQDHIAALGLEPVPVDEEELMGDDYEE